MDIKLIQKDFRELSAVERQQIENEHAHLEQFLWELHEACCEFDSLKECHGCDKEKFASCQGRLISFEYVFIDFVIRHFENEEKIMIEITSEKKNLNIPNERTLHNKVSTDNNQNWFYRVIIILILIVIFLAIINVL